MPDSPFPKSAFYFRLIVGSDATSFLEASGISPATDTGSSEEGGENQFHHRLPKPPKHQNLKLKRGLTKEGGELVTWCKNVLEGGLNKPIETKTVTVELVVGDDEQKPLRTWTFHDAYPLKWEVPALNAKSNEVAVEKLELSYKTVEES